MTARLPPLLVVGDDPQHDPNAGLQGPWTIKIPLRPDETLVGPATVIAVQPDGSDLPLVGDSLVISGIAFAQLTESPNVWGISFNTEGGTPQMYWLRGAAQRTDGVTTYGVNRTVRLPCGNN